jgi:GntR family transcriptional regulator
MSTHVSAPYCQRSVGCDRISPPDWEKTMPKSFTEIANDLERRIGAGEWAPGDKLPTTQALADEYGVSESTMYRALVLLGDRGLVTGEAGVARYVLRAKRA